MCNANIFVIGAVEVWYYVDRASFFNSIVQNLKFGRWMMMDGEKCQNDLNILHQDRRL